MSKWDIPEEEVGRVINEEYSGVSQEDIKTEPVSGNVLENIAVAVIVVVSIVLIVLILK